MRVFHGYAGIPSDCRGASVALGNFDGVHLGHRAVIEAARAARPAAPLGVVTFDPHPRAFFQPDAPAFTLTPLPEKARKLRDLEVDCLFVIAFDAALAGMSPGGFAQDVLHDGLGITAVATGEDFRFGAKRAGDVATLRALGADLGFEVATLDGIGDEDGTLFSSSAAREALRNGRPEEAAAILGEAHRVVGVVEQGDRRGRTIGFPTANLSLENILVPAYGIYAVEVFVGEHGKYEGAASIGIRPTYELERPNLEVHLFDFDGDLYGQEISVALHHYIRPEEKYDTLDALKRQIALDCAEARRLLAA